MPNGDAASAAFESNYHNLLSIVLKRMELELHYHHPGDLEKLEPDLVELFQEFGKLLRVVYRHNLTDVLLREAVWYSSVLSSRGSAQDAFSLLLDSWIIAIQGLIKPPECDLLTEPLQELRNNLALISEEAKKRPLARPDDNVIMLVNHLIIGDQSGAEALLFSLIAQGIKPEELITRYVLSAMVEVGRRWESNELQIFEEHLASETIIRLLAGFFARFRPEKTLKRTALIGCVPEDSHQLVTMALATYLEIKGWRVASLGGSLPAEQFVMAARKIKPDAIFLSLNIVSRLTEALELVSLLCEAIPDGQVFVGGRGAQAGKRLLEASRAVVVKDFEEAHQLASGGNSNHA
jgi:methanogenic corrinoid protein MtbC1